MNTDGFFKKLTPAEEKDYRNFVVEDEPTRDFIRKARCYHPVIKDEICKKIMQDSDKEYHDEKYDSLLEAIENKDEEAIQRFDKQAKEGKQIRIM